MDYSDECIKQTGQRVRSVRLKRGLTQGELGELSGTNQGVIQKIELGKATNPATSWKSPKRCGSIRPGCSLENLGPVKERPEGLSEPPEFTI